MILSILKHIQIGILSAHTDGREFLAKSWGKKGTTSDISLYVTQSHDFLQTTIVPESFPKKILSLFTTAHMSDQVVIGVSSKGLDGAVGEAAILADCLEINGVSVIGMDDQKR